MSLFRSLSLGSFLGVPVTVHWTLVAILLIFGLNGLHEGGLNGAFDSLLFLMGIIVSIVLHEYGHVLAAKGFGINTRSINLNPLGGVAFMEKYPDFPGQRIAVALAGPAVTLFIVIAMGFYLKVDASNMADLSETTLGEIFLINVVVLLFNLLPIYPLDGGQALFGLIHKVAGRRWARAICLYSGQAAAIALITFGVWHSFLVLTLIGLFIFVSTTIDLKSPLIPWLRGELKRRREQREIPMRVTTDMSLENIMGMADASKYGVFIVMDEVGHPVIAVRHWMDYPEGADRDKQKILIEEHEVEAEEEGGFMQLFTSEQFARLSVYA